MDIFWFIFFVIIVLGNILGFTIKRILKENGFEVQKFSGYYKDTKNIFRLAKATEDKNIRRKYILLGLSDILIVPVVFICFIYMILWLPSFNDKACKAFADFKNLEYRVVVVDKYLDKKQHSYPTLILQDSNGNKTINQDFIFENSGFYDYIHIGDTLIKTKNNSDIHLINLKVDTLLHIEYDCKEK